jgi:hypothetical protein
MIIWNDLHPHSIVFRPAFCFRFLLSFRFRVLFLGFSNSHWPPAFFSLIFCSFSFPFPLFSYVLFLFLIFLPLSFFFFLFLVSFFFHFSFPFFFVLRFREPGGRNCRRGRGPARWLHRWGARAPALRPMARTRPPARACCGPAPQCSSQRHPEKKKQKEKKRKQEITKNQQRDKKQTNKQKDKHANEQNNGKPKPHQKQTTIMLNETRFSWHARTWMVSALLLSRATRAARSSPLEAAAEDFSCFFLSMLP